MLHEKHLFFNEHKETKMNDSNDQKSPFVIFLIDQERYAVSSQYVQSIRTVPSVTTLPNTPDYIRGVMKLREHIVPLIDLRVKIGLPSFASNLETEMKQREQDHINWLNELESSVLEMREFKLTTDPHKCKFGLWYDHYTPQSHEEERFLKKFDLPHKKIHKIGLAVEKLLNEQKKDEALSLIRAAKDKELREMITLFPDFIQITKQQIKNEIAIMLEDCNKRTAITVDYIETIGDLIPGSFEPVSEFDDNTKNSLLTGIAKSEQDNALLLILNPFEVFKIATS